MFQAIGFAGASLMGNVFALVATIILTRHMLAAEFGSYSFAISFLFFVAIFFEFGLFTPAARLAAVMDGDASRAVVGSALLLYIPVGAAFAASTVALSYFVDGWFHVDAGHALRVSAVAAGAVPFALVLQQLAQGADRLHVASAATAAAQLLFVVLLAVTLVVHGLSPESAVLIRCLGLLVAGVAAAFWLRPVTAGARKWAGELVRQAREWGFNLFVGRVLSIGTYNMDVLMLAGWTSSRWVGFYTLAGSLAAASGLPVIGIAAALYPKMARASSISGRWLALATLVGAVTALVAWLLAEPAIRVLFAARYLPAAGLVLPLVLATVVRGVTGIFNAFLSAHGRGRDLRNAGLILTGSNLGFNFALIPTFGASGAAWASFFALVANLGAHAYFYWSPRRLVDPSGSTGSGSPHEPRVR
jgi:O-antigen/teichoic acid export membrane protein